MLVTIGLWLGAASIGAIAFESLGAAAVLFGLAALLLRLA
jgi:hypothetical protein